MLVLLLLGRVEVAAVNVDSDTDMFESSYLQSNLTDEGVHRKKREE